MKKQRRNTSEVSLSFLDIISCGFGAIVLLLIIARVGDPTALEEAERQLRGTVRELQEQLFAIRGESATLNRDMRSQQEQLSELRERIARLQEKLASVSRQSRQLSNQQNSEKQQLQLALQVLSEEQERLLPPDSRIQNQLIGGIPVDSEYIIFVIDTSGSMQSAGWQKLQAEMINILDIYPEVKGIQVMNDMGQFMFPASQGNWIPDSPKMRQEIIEKLRLWMPFSNSSPVEGIEAAIKTFYQKGRKVSIYTLGDDFQGRSIRRVKKTVDALNKAHRGSDRLVRIHAIGFPVYFQPGETPTASAVRFAALMRELSYSNGGTFIGLNSLK